jgi:hypothetical protein
LAIFLEKSWIFLQKLQCRGASGVDGAVEAGIATSVASAAAGLFDIEDDGVLVAVGAHFDDFLDLAGSGSFVPDFLARARPVDGFAFFEGEAQRFPIHPGQHQRFACVSIDGYCSEQAVFIEFGCEFKTVFDLFFVDARSKAGAGFVVHAGRLGENERLARQKLVVVNLKSAVDEGMEWIKPLLHLWFECFYWIFWISPDG